MAVGIDVALVVDVKQLNSVRHLWLAGGESNVMTKKQRILNMFNAIDWSDDTKYVHYQHFYQAGLHGTVEFKDGYCDVYYAARIFRSLGYKVSFGMSMYVRRIPLSTPMTTQTEMR